jgi:hypothetical protein
MITAPTQSESAPRDEGPRFSLISARTVDGRPSHLDQHADGLQSSAPEHSYE